MSTKENKPQLFEQLAKPDKTGVSRTVCVTEFKDSYIRLNFENGGSWCRMDGPLACKYKLLTLKKNGQFCKSKGWPNFLNSDPAILALKQEMIDKATADKTKIADYQSNKVCFFKLCGLLGKQFNRGIRPDIRKYFKGKPCVVCGTYSAIEIDHKNDLYNDPRVLDPKTQKIEDFQPLCKHCNDQKREVMVKTKASGKRYPATKIPMLAGCGIPYLKGNETFKETDIHAMEGTFWYDPAAFMKEVFKRLSS